MISHLPVEASSQCFSSRFLHRRRTEGYLRPDWDARVKYRRNSTANEFDVYTGKFGLSTISIIEEILVHGFCLKNRLRGKKIPHFCSLSMTET